MRHWVHALVPSFGRRIERSQSVHINIKQGITSSYSNNIQLRPGKPNSWETETWTPRAHSPLQGILVDVATWPRCCQSFFIRTLWMNSLRSVNTWTLQSFNNKTQKVSKLWIVFSNPTKKMNLCRKDSHWVSIWGSQNEVALFVSKEIVLGHLIYSIINSLYMMWNQKRPPHFETY